MKSEIQFEEEEISLHKHTEPQSRITGLMVKYNLVQNKTQASLLLLGCAIILLAISIYIIAATAHGPKVQPEPDPAGLLKE